MFTRIQLTEIADALDEAAKNMECDLLHPASNYTKDERRSMRVSILKRRALSKKVWALARKGG